MNGPAESALVDVMAWKRSDPPMAEQKESLRISGSAVESSTKTDGVRRPQAIREIPVGKAPDGWRVGAAHFGCEGEP